MLRFLAEAGTPAPPNTWAAIIIAAGTAIATVAAALRVRSRRNGTDVAGVHARMDRMEVTRAADRKQDQARMGRVEEKLDALLLMMAEDRHPAARRRRRPDD